MFGKRLSLGVLTAFVLSLACGSIAHAQATRTWVSGVGDDVNPCSRTAPCKTFAGAISKTAVNGEINVLDQGAYGTVTITKPITISATGVEAGVLATLGVTGIIVNDQQATAATDVVTLRGLDIFGAGTGLDGIRVVGTLGALHVENCTIDGFRGTNGSGIKIATTAAATTQVFIKDTIVRNSGNGTGGGIFILPGAGSTVKASLSNVRMENNLFGFKVQGSTSSATVFDSVAAGNSAAGFSAAISGAVLNIEKSVASNNGTGVVCAAGSTVRIGNMMIAGNGTAVTSAACATFKNNDIDVPGLSFSSLLNPQ